MQGNEGSRQRKLRGLVVGVAALIAASPAMAQDDSTPVRVMNRTAGAATSPANPSPALNIGYFDRYGLPAEVTASMQAEVERLVGKLGVAVNSIDASALSSNEHQPQGLLLNVIVWAELPTAWDVPRHTVGLCPESGKLPRSVYVFASNVLGELGLRSQGVETMRAEDAGRAFGRVAAHEIIHAFATFAGEHRHRGNGLMGAELDKDTLLVPGLEVDDRSGEAFRAGIVKAGGIGSD